jgi:hypothetical protein
MYIILVEDKELLVFQLGIENGRDFGKRALQRIKNCEKQGSYGSWNPGKVMDFYFVK